MLVRVLTVVFASMAAAAHADSFYTQCPDDPKAVTVARASAQAGSADDSGAIQQAIDTVQSTVRQGLVLLPSGRYRLTRVLNVWPGIRVIGCGPTRPVLFLAANTPGYQDPTDESYMVFFAGRRPGANDAGRPAPQKRISGKHGLNLSQPWDATPGTFYSALTNIDLETSGGNPGAVGVRARYAQHCFLSHVDFRLGADTLAGIHDGGNELENVRFFGGQYGIITRKPSPGWPFVLVDATFEGQRLAAIKTHEAGLTLIHPVIRKTPVAISIDPDYGEQLWIKDGRLEDISEAAIVISRENSPRTQIGAEGVVCRNVPVFASFRESGKTLKGPSASYSVATLSHGLHYEHLAAAGSVKTVFDAAPLAELPADRLDLPPLPAFDTWVNVRTLGVTGDGTADDTEAIRKAIAAHATLYFPQGRYRVTDTLTLRPETVLVGLHPSTTAFVLNDGTPAFQGVDGPKAVIEAPRGGTNIMSGLGIYTNGINPRAVAAKWMAGARSMMNDVRFLGGHGTSKADGTREDIYNNTHTADPDLNRRWDGQYPSLWVTDGGGGRFVNIWTPSTFAQAGLYISDTTTEGRVYQMSLEHHVRAEAVLRNVANWAFYGFQAEEERGESGLALPIEIDRSKNLTFANVNMYRVVSSVQPFPYAVKVTESSDIRFRNVHCYGDNKVAFDTLVYDATHDIQLRPRELAWATVTGVRPPAAARAVSPVMAPGARVERLAGGFDNISGGAVDSKGDFYFIDPRRQRIHRWSVASRRLSTVRDSPLDPANLVFDAADNLMVLSAGGAGRVYTFRPDAPGLDVTLLKAQPAAPRPNLNVALPLNYFRHEHDFVDAGAAAKPHHFVSPDGTTFIPAGDDFLTGTLYYGARFHDVLRAFGLGKARPGQRVYVSEESQQETYTAIVDERGTLTDLRLFVPRGGEGMAVDERGNVYLADGQVFVYDGGGTLLDRIDVPERPIQLAFGGADGKTLFIAARTSLYAVRMRAAGRVPR